MDPKDHDSVDTVIKLTLEGDPLSLDVVETDPALRSLTEENGVVITASSSQKKNPPENLLSGSTHFQDGLHHKSPWKPDASDQAPWLEVDFGKPQTFNRIRVEEYLGWTDLSDGVSFQYAGENGQWVEICGRPDYAGYAAAQFNPVTSRKLRVQFRARSQPMGVILLDVYASEGLIRTVRN